MSARRRLALAALVSAVAGLAGPGCGPRGAEGVLDETAAKLGDITSGELRVAITATAGARQDGPPVGFVVQGPFALPAAKGELPVARLEVTRLAGGDRRVTTFVSSGDRAFVEAGGQAYELSGDQVADLRGGEPGEGGLGGLDLDGWARDAEVAAAGTLDGVAAERVTADVDVVRAVNDIVSLAQRLGASGVERVEGDSAEHLRKAVRSARMEVLTGKEDRLLRRLHIEVVLSAPASRVAEALGPLAGSRLRLELDVAKVNSPVKVPAPAEARPPGSFSRRGS